MGPTGAVKVIVATKPVDFRKGAEGLAALVKEQMHTGPFSGVIYVFQAKRADSDVSGHYFRSLTGHLVR